MKSSTPVSPFPPFGNSPRGQQQQQDASASRRAQLEKLRGQLAAGSSGSSAATGALLQRASRASAAGGPPTMNGGSGTAGTLREEPPPQQQGIGVRRESDLYPRAPKANATSDPVNRRLDMSYAVQKNAGGAAPPPRNKPKPPPARPKSAPPRRPQGPPPPTSSSARPRAKSPGPPSRSHVSRPPPVMATSAAAATAPPPPRNATTSRPVVTRADSGETTPPMTNLSTVSINNNSSGGPPPPSLMMPTTESSTTSSFLDASSNHSQSSSYSHSSHRSSSNHSTTSSKENASPAQTPKATSTTMYAGFTPHPSTTTATTATPPTTTSMPYGGGSNGNSTTMYAGATPFPGKQKQPPNGSGNSTMHAGATPFYKANNNCTTMNAGMTPYHPTTTTATMNGSGGSSNNGGRPTPPYTKGLVDMDAAAASPLTTSMNHNNSSNMALSPELRLQKELVHTKNETTMAYNKIASLEDELRELRQNNSTRNNNGNGEAVLSNVLQIAETQGDGAAMKFIRQATAAGQSIDIISSSVTNNSALTSSPLALPKRRQPLASMDALQSFFKEAVETLPFEYDSGKMMVTIRRPYGVGTDSPLEQKLWFDGGEKNAKEYAKSSQANISASLEALVSWTASSNSTSDAVVLLLYGNAMVRYRNPVTGRWVRLGDVVEAANGNGNMNNSNNNNVPLLGKMKDANDQPIAELDLDEAYRNATAARAHYCESAVGTAEALRVQHSKKPAPAASAPAAAAKEPKKKAPPPPPEEEVSAGFSVFDLILSLFRFVFIVFPSRVIFAFLFHLTAIVLLSMFYLYVTDVSVSSGGGPMLASLDYLQNAAAPM